MTGALEAGEQPPKKVNSLSPGARVITRLAGLAASQALWSAAARRRFQGASLLASHPLGYCLRTNSQQAGPAESGSKLSHSKAGFARKIWSSHTDSRGERAGIFTSAPFPAEDMGREPISAYTLWEYYSSESLKIQQDFDLTGDGLAVLCQRSGLVDEVVTRLYCRLFSPQPGEPGNFCLVALGGYGRRELFPHSDIDLLFLSDGNGEEASRREAVAAFLRHLWDLRLRIGHSLHTLAECGRLYRDNLEFNIALLDCRYLAGDCRLYARLHDEVIPRLVARDQRDLAGNLAETARRRHAKYGQTIFHLEPDLKEAPGGLRDYHVCRWLTRISELEKRRAWASPEDVWPEDWQVEAGMAFRFLSAARCFLHYLRERDDNQLSYECQDRGSARGIGCEQGAPLSAADWMRIYFRNVRSIYRLTLRLLDESAPAQAGVYGLFQQWRSRLSNPYFSVIRERVYFRQPAALAGDPALLLRLFEMVARHGLELSREAERVVAQALVGVAASPPAPSLFWDNLRQILLLPWAAKALREMHRLGVLDALFPEFQAIDSLVIRDFFHRYTVDEHSFMTIQNLHALGSSRPKSQGRPDSDAGWEWEGRLADILSELEKPELLYLALLFHDVGKGWEALDHIRGSLEALDAIMARLDLAEADRETVRFLIARHLEMSATLQRRDIFEPETVRQIAESIETTERLKMLTLLTYADIKSVNPEALTPWKAELLWRLYAATANYLARSADEERLRPAVTPASPAERILPLLAPAAAREEVDRFLEGFPRRYLATHAPAEIAGHFQLARQLGQQAVQIDLRPGNGLHHLTVITFDRPFLFASITGTLAAWGMSIVKADAFANAAGVVLDTFHFVDLYRTLELNPSEADRFQSSLVDVLQGRVELGKLMSGRLKSGTLQRAKVTVPTVVYYDDTSSSHSTLLELVTHDRPGLLYQVSSVLAQFGCNIEIALIDTEGEKVIDVFYLTYQGGKLRRELQRAIEGALVSKLQR
jgi:[protein-PII] uridylyltransferase